MPLYPKNFYKEPKKGFPDQLKRHVFSWLESYISAVPLLERLGMNPQLNRQFVREVSFKFDRDFSYDLREHFEPLTNDDELLADYINYLLQTYPRSDFANELEVLLSQANSEYKVHIRTLPIRSNRSNLPEPHDWRDVKASLQFRVPEEANLQLSQLEDNKRIQQAWNDLYDVSRQNLPSVVQKSLDQLAGAIRDRLYPDDKTTNLGKYAKQISDNIDRLDLPKKDILDWPSLITSLASFVNKRSVHNSGTDNDPDYEDAHTVLHLSIALITILKNKNTK